MGNLRQKYTDEELQTISLEEVKKMIEQQMPDAFSVKAPKKAAAKKSSAKKAAPKKAKVAKNKK